MDWPTLPPNPYLDIHAPGDLRIRGTRVDLCVVVEDYLEGHLPEQMAINYPTLDLEAVHGVIAYYLGHRAEVDRYVELCRLRADRMHADIANQPEAPVVTRLRAIKAARTKAA